MFAVLPKPRNLLLRLAALASALWLASCDTGGIGGTGPRINTDAPVPVALLVPGGGGNSGDEFLARGLRQAAEMAIADLQGVKIDLRVYNTGGDPAQAAAVAAQAVNDGAKIILGPVFAEAANAAGRAVAAAGINVLSFSNNTDIAGGNVFVLGPTFPNTANRLVSYAARVGKKRIMVVNEQTGAGEAGARAIVAAIARNGALSAGNFSYPFSQEGVINAIPAIAQRAKSGEVDAIFMTSDTSGALSYLTQLLPEHGVDRALVQFIGLTRWDIPPSTLALPGVQGGWFALPDPGLNGQFAARYQAAFNEPPHPISGLAYDGIAAIGALVRAGHADALTTAALTQGAGFVGVNGIFRLLSDGTNERGLAVAEVRNNQVIVIDPAPRSFGGAGF
ncbi:MAG: penicillin-binding protein activator [Phaeovulum sp.]|uniref:penicillin-binding protein activator n=1 Tax=Phaeovulum sp. TaxID=2934796 RepID=UPI002736C76C|nr:penicillin-binding protein activator [Phaeovulum sp.]MDP3860496.1 penicillin-binding protein activator [Phaeovulum sp.]